MSVHTTIIETVRIVKEDFCFSGDLWRQNVWFSLNSILLPQKILPTRNPCYSMSILIGRMLQDKGIKSRICLAERQSWKKLLPIHVLLSVDDEAFRRWYVDFVFDGQFVVQQDTTPEPSDRLIEAWDYRWEDTLKELLRNNHSIYNILLHTKSFVNRFTPRDWPIKRNYLRSIRRAEILNRNKQNSVLPHFTEESA